mgnify:CR=1 FL=1
MRLKHNKKRNTAFLYEALVRQLTKYIIKQNKYKISQLSGLIKESFNRETSLYRELNIYKPLYEMNSMNTDKARNLIRESKVAHDKLNKQQIFKEQSSLIKKINKTLGSEVYKSFVPNYKNIASVYSIFNLDMSPKDKVILEEKIENSLTSSMESESDNLEHVDNIVYKSFVEKFNSKYSMSLKENQKALLNKYISSFTDNGLELKVYLNEELQSLRETVIEARQSTEFSGDEDFSTRLHTVTNILNNLKENKIDDKMIRKVIKIQDLVEELAKDAS